MEIPREWFLELPNSFLKPCIVILGADRVGKTTLANTICNRLGVRPVYPKTTGEWNPELLYAKCCIVEGPLPQKLIRYMRSRILKIERSGEAIKEIVNHIRWINIIGNSNDIPLAIPIILIRM